MGFCEIFDLSAVGEYSVNEILVVKYELRHNWCSRTRDVISEKDRRFFTEKLWKTIEVEASSKILKLDEKYQWNWKYSRKCVISVAKSNKSPW